MNRTKIRDLDIEANNTAIIEISGIVLDNLVITLNNEMHLITRPKGKAWRDRKLSVGDKIKVAKVYSNENVDKLIFISFQNEEANTNLVSE